jgi:hypothetical protein
MQLRGKFNHSFFKKKLADGPQTAGSTVNNVIAIIDNDIPVFESTLSYDPINEVCSLPAGTIIEILGHHCDRDNLWLSFQVEYIGDAGSVSNPCEGGISYWLPFGGVVGCGGRSLPEILETNEELSLSGKEPYEDVAERLSFEGDSPNFAFNLICKYARKLVHGPDSFNHYSQRSQHDIKDWICGNAVVCQELAFCGSGFYICPSTSLGAWLQPEGEVYGERTMEVLINRCGLSDTMVLCKDAKIPCSDDYGCNNIFEGNNYCSNGYCDYREADFYFMCPEVRGSITPA